MAYPRALEAILNADERDSWLVENRSRIAATIDDVPALLDEIVCAAPEFVVLDVGFPEALLRPHSRRQWYWTYLFVPGRHPYSRAFRTLGRWYSAVRRRFHLMEQWVPARRFERRLSETVAYLRSEAQANVILVEANPWNALVERWNPGSGPQIDLFNDILVRVASQEGAVFFPLDALSERDPGHRPVGDWIPDGSHFNAEGHRLIAGALADLILTLHFGDPDDTTDR